MEKLNNSAEMLLQLEGVKTHFPVFQGVMRRRQVGTVKAVDGVNLELRRGEVLGLVGESGCGKSTLARTIMQLIPPTEGTILLAGRNIARLNASALKKVRTEMQMVFQDPFASLNPRMNVFDIIAEPIRAHRLLPDREVAGRVAELMERVGLSPRFMRKYPHEFSGGQRQRIAVARALALNPQLVIADEPVSALDVSIQAQILNLLGDLCRTMNLAMIFIAHDLSVVKHISDRIAVMYLGKIVEIGPAVDIIETPQHPYTRALISAIPVANPDRERARQRIVLPGDPPSPFNPPEGCPFHPRCPFALPKCQEWPPELLPAGEHRRAACIRLDEI